MINIIKKLGNPILREVAEEIPDIDDSLVALSNKMRFLLTKVDGYGIAAPQIGISKRLFIYNLGDGPQTIINPTIHEHTKEMWLYREGCLSIPGFYFPIWRPRSVCLRGLSIDGSEIKIEATDLLARLFQHELDHLNGILVLDKLNESELSDFKTEWKRIKRK